MAAMVEPPPNAMLASARTWRTSSFEIPLMAAAPLSLPLLWQRSLSHIYALRPGEK
jgi:hypothetical protein